MRPKIKFIILFDSRMSERKYTEISNKFEKLAKKEGVNYWFENEDKFEWRTE